MKITDYAAAHLREGRPTDTTPLRILVTGAGGGVGRSILRCLDMAGYTCLGADCDLYSPSFYDLLGDYRSHYRVVPKASDRYYTQYLDLAAQQMGADLIIPGSDWELARIAKDAEKLRDEERYSVMISAPELIGITRDKLATVYWLRDYGYDFPRTQPVQHAAEEAVDPLPEGACLVKPRFGSGSRGITFFNEPGEARARLRVQDEPLVVQEALEGDEYTTTLVCTGEEENRVLRSVTLWREPKYGPGHEFVRREVREDHPTYTADEWGGRKALIHQIAEQLGIIGPCNIQWRDVPNRGPVVFEINARFPGSTVLCALAGVNLPDIAVQYFLFGHAPSMEPAQPLTFLRTLGEVAVPTTSIIPKPLCK